MKIETYDRSDNEKKSRRERILLVLLLFLIFFLLIFLILKSTGCSDKSDSSDIEFEVLEEIREEGESVELVEKTCLTKEHSWSIIAGGWAELEEPYISPQYVLRNDEDKEGRFKIRYTFFDESVYPYVQFGDSNFEELSEYAAMHSEWKIFTLEPDEEALITIPTLKPEISKNYWAVPDIEAPPAYEVCSTN